MDTTAIGLVAGASMAIIIACLAWLVISIIANWKIFEKAGEAGWKCLIPFYSWYVEYNFSWLGWVGILYAVLLCVPGFLNNAMQGEPNMALSAIVTLAGLAAFVISCIQRIRLAKAFGQGIGFAIGLILLEPIFRVILGFGGAQYVGNPDTTKTL